MGLVYANGLCNIAASASDGPDGGLFRSRNAESIRLGCVRADPLPDTRIQTFNIIDTLYTHRQLRHTPFFKRGWIFQERMLAPRVIYFAEEQVFWECYQELKCEAFPTGIPFAGSFKALLPENLTNLSTWSWGECVPCTMFRQWNRVVQGYSDSQFTFINDKLPAFMGIASYFEPLMGADYAFAPYPQMAAAEKDNTDKLQVIHGDFWTGNIVLPNAAIKEGTEIPLFVVNWELTRLGLPSVDFGQMIAEMYALWLWKSVDAGLWMMEGFIKGYGARGPENYERVVAVGRDIIVHAWKKDREWFEEGDLACLFRSEN
ncbi:hypothetical protein FOYG_03844 [Fusarium oxysporum NRRL 32931]|uniref:Aminoglycoside phosphotransferase domain-containing protein n=1 Tax=Fusarium oxysporum NRRL 32931 TaxID=660029 RepID=W9IYZ7_FUSOX|nr:hypothetical protein FOYG_03844 [Fusarium oxysporum NRRL 32931]